MYTANIANMPLVLVKELSRNHTATTTVTPDTIKQHKKCVKSRILFSKIKATIINMMVSFTRCRTKRQTERKKTLKQRKCFPTDHVWGIKWHYLSYAFTCKHVRLNHSQGMSILSKH